MRATSSVERALVSGTKGPGFDPRVARQRQIPNRNPIRWDTLETPSTVTLCETFGQDTDPHGLHALVSLVR